MDLPNKEVSIATSHLCVCNVDHVLAKTKTFSFNPQSKSVCPFVHAMDFFFLTIIHTRMLKRVKVSRPSIRRTEHAHLVDVEVDFGG